MSTFRHFLFIVFPTYSLLCLNHYNGPRARESLKGHQSRLRQGSRSGAGQAGSQGRPWSCCEPSPRAHVPKVQCEVKECGGFSDTEPARPLPPCTL